MPLTLNLLMWHMNIFPSPLITVQCNKQIYTTATQKLILFSIIKTFPQLTKARRCCHLWAAAKLL